MHVFSVWVLRQYLLYALYPQFLLETHLLRLHYLSPSPSPVVEAV